MNTHTTKTHGGSVKSFAADAFELPFVPHSPAAGTDGKILPWRDNNSDQSNNGELESEWRTILNESYLSLKLKNDGTVWSSGSNSSGHLGNGTVYERSIFEPVNGLTDVTAIVNGEYYGMALKKDGTVWEWRYNGNGELGLRNRIKGHWLPEQVKNLNDIVAVFRGMALKNDGTVWEWGWKCAPRSMGLSGIVAICSGKKHNMALRSDGTVWSWGENDYGQLGDGSFTDRSFPVQAVGLVEIIAISISESSNAYNSWALKDDGTVWIWGTNKEAHSFRPEVDNYPIGNINLYGKASSIPVQIAVVCSITDLPHVGARKVVFKNNRSVVLEYIHEAPNSDPYWLRSIQGQEKDGTLLERTIIMQGSIVPEQPCVQRGSYSSSEQGFYNVSR